MSKSVQELKEEYQRLCHAMQTGVAMKLNYESADCEKKHLRVGINSAMSEHAALVRLLLDKGVITEEEYFQTLCEYMQKEVDFYKEWLQGFLGAPVDLI